MPLGQGFLNSWLKVNSKHVVIPNKNDKEGKVEGPNRTAAKKNNSFETANTAHTTTSGEAERSRINQRFKNRKNRRRLHRTVSASDLIRDKISGKGKKEDGVVEEDGSSHEQSSIFGSNRSQHKSNSIFGSNRSQKQSKQHEQQHDDSSSQPPAKPLHEEQKAGSLDKSQISQGSLRFVAGFFGADINTVASNDTMDLTSAKSHSHAKHDSSSAVSSRDGLSLPARIKPKPVGGGIGIRFPPNIFASERTQAEKCQGCNQLEDELALAREDVEYLRGVALRNEYTYSAGQHSTANVETSDRDSSKSEVGSAQLEEIEEMKKEWDLMQDEMQLEIQKYADLCVNLNEEAELRNEEAMNLHVELNTVSRERDEMVTEMETLRAKVAEYEKRDQERRKAEHLLHEYEEKGMEFATREIQARDAIIDDLSRRLEFALDTITLEREAQNQRRQIIFPNQRANHNSTAAMEEELKATKESLQRAEQMIEMLLQQNNSGMERE